VARAETAAAPARPAAVPTPQPVGILKGVEAGEIGRLLGTTEEASPAKITKALEQSGGRWAVAEARKAASPERPWVAELLPGPVAYWRVRSLGVAVSEAMGRDWVVWKQKNPLGAVLDLRECKPAQSLAAAAEVAGLFVTPGEVLFTWRDGAGREKVFRSDRQPLGLGEGYPLIVLVGPELRGAGELLAYLLQERGGAILVGQSTAGQMGWLAETRLSTGRSLYRSKGEIVLPGGQAPLGRPLPPDLNLASGSVVDTEIWPGGEATIA
jgi:carboxyl-terminal processing protease